KDGRGTWHSTQATVLALKALLAGTGRPLGGDAPRRIVVRLDGHELEEITIPADQAGVLRQVDPSDRMTPRTPPPTLEERGGSGSGYKVVSRYHVPGEAPEKNESQLAIQIEYERAAVVVDEVLSATAKVSTNGSASIPMIVLDLPIPPGFALQPEDLDGL